MKRFKKVTNSKGLTIIEVLIASTVFMIGFSILVFFLGEIVGKYSAKDITIAFNLGTEYMEKTLASRNFAERIDTLTVSNITFRIEKRAENINGLNKIRINVYREKQGKLLISLYNEKYIETY